MVSEFLHSPEIAGRKICAALGVFDGVHQGHRRIIAEVAGMARSCGAISAALTFHPHPRAVISGDPPPLLIPLARRVELLKEAGADAVGIIDFTPEFAAMPPETFLRELLGSGCRICGIAVGANWRFGKGGAGTPEMLTEAASRDGFRFSCVSLLTADGERISSSLIRQEAASGDLQKVREHLGRDLELYGTVVSDLHIGSSRLGFPTANLALEAGVPPPNGVYAGLLDGMAAAVNIGVSPSVEANGLRHRIEAHVIDRQVELRGKSVKLQIVQKIRGEEKFPSFDALSARISADIHEIRQILSAYCK